MIQQQTIARLFVPGRPRTKGSLKPIHQRGSAGRPCRIGLTEDHASSKPWMRKMTMFLRNVQAGSLPTASPWAGPVEVFAFFRFEQERSVAAKTAGEVVPSQDTAWPTAPAIGDEDKLRRSVLDALTQSHLLADDALVVGGNNYKRWVMGDEPSGVAILVRTAPDPRDVAMMERMLWMASDG